MSWKQYDLLGAILDFHYKSIEMDILRYIYRILFLQIFLSMLYPIILYGNVDIPFSTECLFKGITFLALAFTASHFQQREIFIFPEGRFGRLASSCIPAFFLVAVYFSFDNNLGEYWLGWISAVMFLYLLKTIFIKQNLKKGNVFLVPVAVGKKEQPDSADEDDPGITLHLPLKTYRRNLISWMVLTLVIFGFVQLLAYGDTLFSSNVWHLLASIVYAGINCFVIIIYRKNSDLANHEQYIKIINIHFLKEDAKPSFFN